MALVPLVTLSAPCTQGILVLADIVTYSWPNYPALFGKVHNIYPLPLPPTGKSQQLPLCVTPVKELS